MSWASRGLRKTSGRPWGGRPGGGGRKATSLHTPMAAQAALRASAVPRACRSLKKMRATGSPLGAPPPPLMLLGCCSGCASSRGRLPPAARGGAAASKGRLGPPLGPLCPRPSIAAASFVRAGFTSSCLSPMGRPVSPTMAAAACSACTNSTKAYEPCLSGRSARGPYLLNHRMRSSTEAFTAWPTNRRLQGGAWPGGAGRCAAPAEDESSSRCSSSGASKPPSKPPPSSKDMAGGSSWEAGEPRAVYLDFAWGGGAVLPGPCSLQHICQCARARAAPRSTADHPARRRGGGGNVFAL